MSDIETVMTQRPNGIRIEGYKRIVYDFSFLDGVLDCRNSQLGDCFKQRGRCLAVMDENVYRIYGDRILEYFDHHEINLKVHEVKAGETHKSVDTFLGIVDSMSDFGIYRKEPVLVIGGGVVTDVAGFACATYRRSTDFIRIPTTLIGLIDASIAIKVAFNHGNYKNRLGTYHPAMKTFLDFSFLKTLPQAEIRNGLAELVKVSSCAHVETFNLIDKYCEELIDSSFGRLDGASSAVQLAAEKVTKSGISEMLKLETPDLHETKLDRVMTFGHTWSPLHELAPNPPLRHGHAVSIDMAYSASLAKHCGVLSNDEYLRFLKLLSRAGLSLDHHRFDKEILTQATQAILRVRDGKLRIPVPSPLGECVFLNDVTMELLYNVLEQHKIVVKSYPRGGEGVEAFVIHV